MILVRVDRERNIRSVAVKNRIGVAMANENGEWIMRGLDWNDPYRICSRKELKIG